MSEFLAIFDVDGTLVDSEAIIVGTMVKAFSKSGVTPPEPDRIRSLIGLSLNRMIAMLAYGQSEAVVARILADYRLGFAQAVEASDPSELFPGVEAGLARLAQEGVILGIATGKSKRGLDRLIESYRWGSLFVTRQCADFHPSKPHPSMIRQALTETGIDTDRAVMIGDSLYDIEMALAAGTPAIAVNWGYHPGAALRDAGAVALARDFDHLVDLILERAI